MEVVSSYVENKDKFTNEEAEKDLVTSKLVTGLERR